VGVNRDVIEKTPPFLETDLGVNIWISLCGCSNV